jgi:hypothetical protein
MSVGSSWKPPTYSASTTTPIVFAASCRPWPIDMRRADTVWA